MSYRASEAFDLDMQEAREAGYATQRRPRRSLDVVEGGHLDADVRRGVSAAFVSHVRLVVIAVVVFCVLGAVRVALTSQTVGLMSQNLKLSSQIEEADALNDELHAERSLLSSSSRIRRIATENYGMVYDPSTAEVTVGRQAGTSGPAATSADVAQDAD